MFLLWSGQFFLDIKLLAMLLLANSTIIYISTEINSQRGSFIVLQKVGERSRNGEACWNILWAMFSSGDWLQSFLHKAAERSNETIFCFQVVIINKWDKLFKILTVSSWRFFCQINYYWQLSVTSCFYPNENSMAAIMYKKGQFVYEMFMYFEQKYFNNHINNGPLLIY